MLARFHTKPRLQLLDATLAALKQAGNDRAIAILTQTFYKAQFKNDGDLAMLATWLAHARDHWLPQTLDCLKDDSKFILDISEQLQSALGLYVGLIALERKCGLTVLSDPQHIAHARQKYFEALHHTI